MKKQGNLMCPLSGTVFLCSCHPYTLHVWPVLFSHTTKLLEVCFWSLVCHFLYGLWLVAVLFLYFITFHFLLDG